MDTCVLCYFSRQKQRLGCKDTSPKVACNLLHVGLYHRVSGKIARTLSQFVLTAVIIAGQANNIWVKNIPPFANVIQLLL